MTKSCQQYLKKTLKVKFNGNSSTNFDLKLQGLVIDLQNPRKWSVEYEWIEQAYIRFSKTKHFFWPHQTSKEAVVKLLLCDMSIRQNYGTKGTKIAFSTFLP